jgi:hypothetical protein
MRLFYSKGSNPQLVGYKDASYLSDTYKGQSQTKYLFFSGNTTISWRLSSKLRLSQFMEPANFIKILLCT